MNDKEKLKRYLEYKGITKNAFHTNMGYATRFLDSGKSMGVDKLREIVKKYPDLNIDWLVLNKGPMIVDEQPLRKILKTHRVDENRLQAFKDSKRFQEIKHELEAGNYENVKEMLNISEQSMEKLMELLDSYTNLIHFIYNELN